MPVVVERTINVASAPETVWGLLANPAAWKTWWPGCVMASTFDQRTLHEGSQLELVVQPRHRKMTFNPVVDLLTEGRNLSLTQHSALIQGTVEWTVSEGPAGARVKVRGVLTGFQVWVQGLFGQNTIFESHLYAHLRGLKKLAERMV